MMSNNATAVARKESPKGFVVERGAYSVPARVLFWIACFIAPIALFIGASVLGGVYPFGPESFLTEDGKFQYIDYFTWLKHCTMGEASLLYMPYTGLGMNGWGLFGYYLSSPFNLLIFFFDEDHLTLFMWVITALKLGCIQVACVWFLRRRFQLAPGYAFALSIGFVWSTWTATQLRNPMWLDALIILPIAAYGVYLLVRDARWVPLAISCAISIIICWYMAYMTILFLALYAIIEVIVARARGDNLPARQVARRVLLFMVAMMFAVLVSAFTFLPTIYSMLGGRPSLGIIYMRLTYVRTFVGGFFLGNWLLDLSPQHFAGTLPAILGIAFLFIRAIPLRVRIASAVLVAFMLLSAYLLPIMYVWCGFRPPSGFYCRITFLTLFFLVWMASYALVTLHTGSQPDVEPTPRQRSQAKLRALKPVIIAAVVIVVATAAVWIIGWFYQPVNAAIIVVLVVVYTALLAALLRGAQGAGRAAASVGLCVLMFGEMLYGTHCAWQQLYINYTQEYHLNYVSEARDQMAELKASDNSLYRMDKTYTRAYDAALNEGMPRDYYALSSYASSQDFTATDMLEDMGYSNAGEFMMRYAKSLLVTDSLLGVKYVVSNQRPAEFVDTDIRGVSGSMWVKDCNLYRNPYALPLGYGASSDAVDFKFASEVNPFKRHNALVSAILGENVELYVPLKAQETARDEEHLEYVVEVPAGFVGYAYVVTPEYGPVFMSMDNGEVFRENWPWQHAFNAFGDAVDEPTVHSVSIMRFVPGPTEADAGIPQPIPEGLDLQLYGLNMKTFNQVIEKLGSSPVVFDKFEAGHIEATYDAAEDGYALITVPAALGWETVVNGQVVETAKICNGGLTLVPVSKGSNSIVMNFTPPGLWVGCGVSVVSLLVLVVICLVGRRRRKRDVSFGS